MLRMQCSSVNTRLMLVNQPETHPLNPLPLDLAASLLKWDPQLARLRYRLVPARIKEPVFWDQYMQQVALTIMKHKPKVGLFPAELLCGALTLRCVAVNLSL